MREGSVSIKHNDDTSPFPDIDEIVKKFNFDQGAAIMILQNIQGLYGYVAPEMLVRISELSGIPTSDLYSIVTFYSQFRLEPPGENFIQVCHGTACHLAGAEKISEAIQTATGARAGHTSPDGKFTVEHVACLGCCSHGPIITMNHEIYAKMTPDKARNLIKDKNQGCHCHNRQAGELREGSGLSERN